MAARGLVWGMAAALLLVIAVVAVIGGRTILGVVDAELAGREARLRAGQTALEEQLARDRDRTAGALANMVPTRLLEEKLAAVETRLRERDAALALELSNLRAQAALSQLGAEKPRGSGQIQAVEMELSGDACACVDPAANRALCRVPLPPEAARRRLLGVALGLPQTNSVGATALSLGGMTGESVLIEAQRTDRPAGKWCPEQDAEWRWAGSLLLFWATE
jgi:hypothetical protein